MNNIYEETMDN